MIEANKTSDCVVFSKTKESIGGFSNMGKRLFRFLMDKHLPPSSTLGLAA